MLRRAASHTLLLAPLLFAAPAASQQPIPYGPPHRAEGVYRTAFETSSFDGCWVRFTERGTADFQRLFPSTNRGMPGRGRAYQVSWLIRRTPDSTAGRWQGYGHLGGSKCQVEVQRVYRMTPVR